MQGISRLIAGDSIDFNTVLASYPASDGWTLKYRLVPLFSTPAQTPITLTASPYQTDDYRTQASPSETDGWAPGAYSWSSWVEQSGQRITIEQGQSLTIAPDPKTSLQGVDTRSDNAIALADAELALRQWNPTRKSFRIGEREVEFNSMAEIVQKINFLRNEVAREQALQAGVAYTGRRRRLLVRLGR